jgi:hypothetical protein
MTYIENDEMLYAMLEEGGKLVFGDKGEQLQPLSPGWCPKGSQG